MGGVCVGGEQPFVAFGPETLRDNGQEDKDTSCRADHQVMRTRSSNLLSFCVRVAETLKTEERTQDIKQLC